MDVFSPNALPFETERDTGRCPIPARRDERLIEGLWNDEETLKRNAEPIPIAFLKLASESLSR